MNKIGCEYLLRFFKVFGKFIMKASQLTHKLTFIKISRVIFSYIYTYKVCVSEKTDWQKNNFDQFIGKELTHHSTYSVCLVNN